MGIHRLKQTFGALEKKSRRYKLYLEFKALFASDKNQKALRNELETMEQPGIPHIGIFLSDLVFIDDGNEDVVDGKINFKKYELLSDRISWLQMFQQSPFPFRKLPNVQETFVHMKPLPEDFLYNLSLAVEPRVRPVN